VTVTTTSSTTAPMAGDGSNASWPFTFPVQASSQLEVVVRNGAGTESVISSTLYSVALTNSGRSGGTVTYPLGSTRLTSSDYLVVRRSVEVSQPTNLRNQGVLAPETLEAIADRAVYQTQQVADDANRALKIARTDTGTLDNLPTATVRAGKYLYFDDDGQPAVSTSVTETGSFTNAGTGAVSRTIAARLMETISVKDFGALGDGSTDDTTKIQAALDAAEASGAVVHFPAGQYVITATLLVPNGVTLQGDGIGFWDTVFTSRAKTWTGTTILAKGTATKAYSRYGITSMRYSGGRRIDPDVGATSYYMTSFANADASGTTRATPRTFSAAIAPKTTHASAHWGLRDLRVAPWLGTNGMADYSSAVPTALADNWDIGVLLEDSEYVTLERVQVVGYWRMAAVAMLSFGLTDYGQAERNLISQCKLQGYVGLLMRSSDTWKVTATTGSSATVYWSEEHYWPSTGTFEAPGGTIYTYTGLSYSAPGLTFTGVTPDPSSPAITQLRNPKRGSGIAGTEIRDTFIAGLDHTSGGVATALGFTYASRPLEMSGYPMRGVQFYNSKCQTREKVVAFLHAVDDCLWTGGQFEGSTSFLIASPLASSADPTSAPAATSDTEDLRFLSTMQSSIDTRLLTPRHFHDDLRTINPASRLNSNFVIEPLAGQDVQVRLVSGQNFYVNDSSNVGRFRVTETGNVLIQSGGQLSLTGGTAMINVDTAQDFRVRHGTTNRLQMFATTGNWGAGSDNALTWGTASFRWDTIYAGTGAINTSDVREKTDLADSDLGLAFVQALRPVSYKLVDGTSGRTHYGLIAQEVEQAMAAAGKTDQDFAGFVRTPLTETGEDGQEQPTGEARYGLRYDEFLAPVLKSIQELARRLEELEGKLAEKEL
jgi:hypothetical protein